jgi:hypothetical protein
MSQRQHDESRECHAQSERQHFGGDEELHDHKDAEDDAEAQRWPPLADEELVECEEDEGWKS